MNYLKNEKFSIRKSSLGVASVVIGLFFLSPAAQADSVDEVSVMTESIETLSDSTTSEKNVATKEKTEETIPESNQLINVQELWKEDIKGQGQVVAIIDSGADTASDVMRVTDISKARVQSEEETEVLKDKAGISYGTWVNDKVIYAHNYNDWNDEIKEAETRSHGMIVASSAVANPSQVSPNGELVPGVAPEAQLMFMRVFSDQHSGTQPYIYLKAVEDAVKLGADVINLSLGGESALTNEVGQLTNEMVELARKDGIIITAAAGNSKVFGFGHANPSVENPDYSLVSRPSVARNVLSVGALNNSVNNVEIVTIPQLENQDTLTAAERKIYAFEANKLPANQTFSYIVIENGDEASFADKTLIDKVALVLRGQEKVADIVSNAIKAGAKAVLIANDAERGETVKGEYIDDLEQEIPVSFIGYKAGQLLAQSESAYTLQFDGTRIKLPHEKAGELLDFTSWGFSGDGFIKPDIIAPGGKVFAAINDGRYDTDQGTSFSSPHVAGAVALIKQVLNQRFPELQGEALHDTIKGLIMSQAKPHIDPETGAYTSPRRQGAGLLDVSKAAYGELIVAGKDGYPSLSLGNVKDNFALTLSLENLGLTDKEVTVSYVLNTDQAENGHVTLRPRLLKEENLGETLLLKAGQSTPLALRVDASAFSEELEQTFPNGYFLEGFVFVKDAQTGEKLASIPYAGFRGEFQNLSAFEKPIYDFTNNERPFYYYEKESQEKDPENHFTALTGIKEISGEAVEIVLGETFDEDTQSYQYDAHHLAFSPNGDHQLDDISLKVTALRNYENVQLTVYAKDDTNRENPLYQHGNEKGEKSYYDDGVDKKSETLEATLWDGYDQDGNLLPDGDYQYVVTYRPAASGAQVQELSFLVTIDTVAPQIDGQAGEFDEQTRIFKPASVVETGSGVESIVLLTKKNGQEQSLSANADGSFLLPEGLSLEDLDLLVTDYAGNSTRLNLAGKPIESLTEEDTSQDTSKKSTKEETASGPSLEVKFIVDGKAKPRYNSTGRYIVTDETGKRVDGEFVVNKSSLPEINLGKYKVELVLLGENLELLSPKVVEVDLTADNPNQVVTFEVVKHVLNKFDVLFDQDVPEGTKVYAIDETGKSTELLFGTIDKRTFENRLVNGRYQIVVELPEGYEINQNNIDYEVGNKLNRQLLSIRQQETKTTPGLIIPLEVTETSSNNYRVSIAEPTKLVLVEQVGDTQVDLLVADETVVEDTSLQENATEHSSQATLPKTSSVNSGGLVLLGFLIQVMLAPLYLVKRK